ncbi:protein bric-a-brac 2 [Caerostris darwini]|uniref:Protein bric-a-brac 2 n=1 Tax=Caerostris darwini TaxID=1538125 RepID=A0AAV4QM30_9ARAC|nr:protein bric-a-brac 2 [Caerostris darwini]
MRIDYEINHSQTTYIFVLTSHCLILICATMSQQFCLKWNNHTTNMLQVFDNLLSTEALVDVTLACEGFSLKAHKMVLSACSPFFQSLFLDNPCKHPIVIMKDMRYTDLKAIIDFMYRGEVNVSHDQLSALLKTAETLKVKGLAEVTGENRHTSGIVQQEITAPSAAGPPTAQRTDTPPLGGKRKRGRPRKRSHSDSNRSDDEGVATKIKERDSPEVEELSGDASMEAPSDNGLRVPNSSNSLSQVPSHSSNNVNSFSNSHLSIAQDSQVDDQVSGDENEFEVEPSKLLEQTLTTDNVPSNSQNSTGHVNLPSVSGLEISRRSMSSTDSVSQAVVPASDSLGSNLQGPDSPQDIKPQILSFDDPPISPVAGTSHGSERSMMMYMDQSGVASIPGPSNYQDNSALVPHDSQPQGEVAECCEVMFQVIKLCGGTNDLGCRSCRQQL